MGYYDSVKDDVKEKASKENSSSNNKASFNTLKENAQKESEKEEKDKGDDTPIEVLEEGLEEKSQNQRKVKSSSEDSLGSSDSNPLTSNSKTESSVEDSGELADKLDTIIDQNRKMIEILESFGE